MMQLREKSNLPLTMRQNRHDIFNGPEKVECARRQGRPHEVNMEFMRSAGKANDLAPLSN